MLRESGASLRFYSFYLAANVIPLTIFWWFFHWQILVVTNARWLLQGDWGAAVLGWNALRHDGWRWPLGSTELLAWPTGTPVTFTDSNPLVSLLLKPVAGLLPDPFQFAGLWLLACVVLQFWAGYLLMRHVAEDRLRRVIGATLIALVPAMLARIGHLNLCAHWTILLSLNVYLNIAREGRRDLWFAVLLALSALIHPYFLPMNAAIWGSDVLRRSWPRLRGRDLAGIGGLAGRSLAVLAAPITALWATGAIGGFEGNAGGFGYYSMPLDALFNPMQPTWSRWLDPRPMGEGQGEGFQYLGVGLLALLAMGLALLATRSGRARLGRMGWFAWLLPAMAVLTALALSGDVQLGGKVLAKVSYEWLPFNLTGAFRASGRLFWPCAYILVLAGLEVVLGLRRPLAVGLGLAALVLQILDLTGFATGIRSLTNEATKPQVWWRTSSIKWEPLIASAKVVEFQPPDPHKDGQLFYDLAWRASSMGRPVNVMYTARSHPRQRAYEKASRTRFLTGNLEPDHLYVVTDGCTTGGIDPRRLNLVNNTLIIAPEGARYPFVMRPAPAPEPFPMGRAVSFEADPEPFRCVLAGDWGGTEGWGVWSDGAEPQLVLRLAQPPTGDLLLTINAQPHPDPQGLSVVVGGRTIHRWTLRGPAKDYQARVPRALIDRPVLHVVLRVDRPTAPSEISESTDDRLLGVGLRAVRLDPAP